MRGRPIALQMLIVTVVTAVIVGVVLGVVVKQLELSTFRSQLQTSSKSTVAAVAAAAATAIVSEDGPVLQRVARDVRNIQPDIYEITILNEEGQILAESRDASVGGQKAEYIFSDDVVHMGEHFGSIRISWNSDEAIEEMTRYAWRAGIISAVGVLLVALMLLILVRQLVVRPTQLIARRVGAIQQGQEPPSFQGEPAIELVVLNDAVDSLAATVDALRTAERQYRQLFNNDITGNFVSSPQAEIVDCNAAFVRMYGLASTEDAKSRGVLELWGSGDDREKVIDALKVHRRLYHQEIQVQRVDGSTLYGLQNLVGIFDDQGNLCQVQGYVMDLTEHHEVEMQLRQAERMNALGRLAGGIAHDFNNSLTVILGHCELLLQQVSDNNDIAERLKAIRSSVKRSASLTEQLRVLSYQERSEGALSDASNVIVQVLKMLKRILRSDIDLEYKVAPDLGAAQIGAGPLESILLNLINNSRDAMPDGGSINIVVVAVELDERGVNWPTHWFDASPGPYIKISLTDTGCGMDQKTMAQAFEPFFTTKHFSKGTGLGLSSVFGLVRRAGGAIDLDSTLGQGTRVDVWIPRSPDSDQAILSTLERSKEVVSPVRKSKILVVDDESAIRVLIHAVLEGAGHEVFEASDGREALACLEEHPEISLLISDLTMPGMSGEELIMHAKKAKPLLRVLAISGHAEQDGGLLKLEHGSIQSLCKPFGTNELVECVAKVLGNHEKTVGK